MPKPKVELGILIRTQRDGDYFHVVGYPVVTNHEGYYRKPWGPSDDPINGFPLLANLRINSQGDNSTRRATGRESALYGFDVEYRDVFSVDAQKATAMAKTLAKLTKRLEAMRQTRGYVKSFGEYVGRVAEALGADQIIQEVKDSQFGRVQDYRWFDLGDGVRYIDGLEREWRDEGKPVGQSA